MVGFVEAEVEVLPRFGLVGEGREILEPRRDGEIGRKSLVVGRIDILQAPGEGEAVGVRVGFVEEAPEFGTGADRDAKRQVADRRRRREVADRKRAQAVLTPGAELKRVRIEVEGREHIESDLRPSDLLLFARRGRVEISESLGC